MRVINDIDSEKEAIIKSIEKFGYDAEHNYYCYMYNLGDDETPAIMLFEDSSCVLAKFDKTNEWTIFSGILSAKQDRVHKLMEFLDYAFSNNAKKVSVEFDEEFRDELLTFLKNNDLYRAIKPKYSLTWPVFNMKTWNGDAMIGKDWKDMRYYWNRFFKENKVEFKMGGECSKNDMKELVIEWKKSRTAKDRTYTDYYLNAIENGFKGYDHVRIMTVDGKICSITAGFKVPNRNYYYSSIGIYNKKVPRIGEISNMDDLMFLKKKSFEEVDFGGGEEALTEFKKKFKPDHYYKTVLFSIVKK